MENGISTLRASHAFIEVVVHIDSKRAAWNGTFIRVAVDTTCRDVLAEFLPSHAPDYSPLPGDCKVILLCTKISETLQGRSAADVGVDKVCSAFLDFLVSIPLTEVPTMRLIFKCFRQVQERRPRVDVVVALMSSRSTTNDHLPLVRE